MADDLARRREVAAAAVRAAGEVHRRYYASGVAIETKGGDRRNLLTLADTEGQAAAKAVIGAAFPAERVIGEEDGLRREELGQYLDECWVIDPLDATLNYAHDFPVFAAGVAFVVDRRPLAGAVYASAQDELFAAARGLGARLNGKPIGVGPQRRLRDAFVGVNIRVVTPAAVEQFLATTGRLLPAAHGVRLLGCPMVSMAYVACGRLDCFATFSPSSLGPWDVAPPAIVLEEAGGAVATQLGEPFDILSAGIAGASSQALLDEMFAVARGEAAT